MYKQYQLKERHTSSNNHLSPRVHTSSHKSKRNSLTKVPSNSPSNSESQHSTQQLANGQKSSTDYDDDDTLSSVTLRNELLAPRASAEADDQLSNSIGDFSDDQLLDEEPTKNEAKEYTGRYNECDYVYFAQMQLARAHWMQLHKTNMQLPVIARTFARLLQHQPHLRVLWPFSRQLEGGGCTLRMEHLLKSEAFRHHCQCYQASFTMIMDNVDDEPALSHILQQFGSNHFFYDCIEPHIRMMREEFFNALVDCLIGSSEELDEDIAEDWDALWSKIESNMRFGLKVQRHNYLAHCLTSNEMELLRAQWYRLAGAGSGIVQLATSIGTAGAEPFINSIISFGMIEHDNQLTRCSFREMFVNACRELLLAIEKAIALWEPSSGFLRLCNEIDAKCPNTDELIHRVGAPLIRRAFIEALNKELFILLNRDQPSPTVHILEEGVPIENKNVTKKFSATNASMIHTWTKVYRVVEQAIIADELTRSGRL